MFHSNFIHYRTSPSYVKGASVRAGGKRMLAVRYLGRVFKKFTWRDGTLHSAAIFKLAQNGIL